MITDACASHPGTADVRTYVARPVVSAPVSHIAEAGWRRPLSVSADLLGLSGLLGLGLIRPSSA